MAAYMDQAERVNAPEDLTKVFTGYFQTLDQFQKFDTERRSRSAITSTSSITEARATAPGSSPVARATAFAGPVRAARQ